MYWTAELSRSRRSAPVSGSDVSDRRFGVRQAFKNRHATGPGAESRRLTRRHPRARHALLHAVLHACAKAPADLFSLHLTPSATRWCMGVCRRQRRHRPRARPQRGMSDCRRCASGAAPADHACDAATVDHACGAGRDGEAAVGVQAVCDAVEARQPAARGLLEPGAPAGAPRAASPRERNGPTRAAVGASSPSVPPHSHLLRDGRVEYRCRSARHTRKP